MTLLAGQLNLLLGSYFPEVSIDEEAHPRLKYSKQDRPACLVLASRSDCLKIQQDDR